MLVDEARDVCQNRSMWRAIVSVFPVGEKYLHDESNNKDFGTTWRSVGFDYYVPIRKMKFSNKFFGYFDQFSSLREFSSL